MTDNEIINALECCGIDDCDCCPCYTEELGCDHNLQLLALDLINRQKAEVERQIYALENECDHCACNLLVQRDKARAEAIKEFSERLREMLDCEFCYEDIYRNPKEETYRLIDRVVKEMTE